MKKRENNSSENDSDPIPSTGKYWIVKWSTSVPACLKNKFAERVRMDSKDHTLHLLQALHSPHSVARRLSETTRRNVRSPSGTLSPGDFGAAAHSLDDVASASFLSAARQWRMVKASLTSWPTATKKTPPLRSPLSSPSLANAVKSPTMLIWSGTTQRRNMDEGGDGEQYKSEHRHKDGSLSVRNVNGAPEPCASLEEIAEAFILCSAECGIHAAVTRIIRNVKDSFSIHIAQRRVQNLRSSHTNHKKG